MNQFQLGSERYLGSEKSIRKMLEEEKPEQTTDALSVKPLATPPSPSPSPESQTSVQRIAKYTSDGKPVMS